MTVTIKVGTRNFSFEKDGNFNVKVQSSTWERPVWIPESVLLAYAAAAVKAQRIREIESATPAEVLGIKVL